jgi:hypothetical protein
MGVPTKIKRFEDLIVWQKSMSLAEEVYQATKQEKFAKDWELKNISKEPPYQFHPI